MADLARLTLPPTRPRSAGGQNFLDATPLYLKGEFAGFSADGVALAGGQRLDLGTWLNAAPAGWWHEILGPIALHLTVRGSGICTVWRATNGQAAASAPARVASQKTFVLPCDGSVDWYWLEWQALESCDRLEAATWSAPGLQEPEAPVTVVVPTFRRETDCEQQVRRFLLADPATVGRIIVVDQGRTFIDHCRSHGLEPNATDRLLVVEQDNWGGSGGYGRGMRESLAWPTSPVLVLDDDARIEIETVRRMQLLSTHAQTPTLLGTALFAAEDPTSLQSLSEGILRRIFQWGPNDGVRPGVRPSETRPDCWTFTRPTDRAEYAGWWGAMLPAGMVETVGEPAPYFLKWDDAEYGLRAVEAGYQVRTLPTTAVWHPTWAAKGTISSWDAWPLHRNRLETAHRYHAGPGVVLDSFLHQIKHVLSLQYETAELWNCAIEEYLGGPGWMSDGPGEVRNRAAKALAAGQQKTQEAGNLLGTEAGPLEARPGGLPGSLVRSLIGLVLPNRGRVRVRLGATEFHWTSTLGADQAILASVEPNEPPAILIRQPQRGRSILKRAAALHVRLLSR